MSLVNQVYNAISNIIPTNKDFIALHEPKFKGNEWDYVKECLDTGWVSSVGKFVDEFEIKLAEFTGVKRAIAVVNGTAALHICLKLVGVRENDEVLIPTLTFIATANAVSYMGAIPHLVDSEERTLGLDPGKLEDYLSEIAEIRDKDCFNKETGRRIKAVIPMHTFGCPVDMDPLHKVCKKYNIELIEDAAESLGSFYKEKHTGGVGTVSALSFNGNKIITTGGGGAILTNDEELGNLAKHITTTAKIPHRWEFNHSEIAYNYRLPNINAAIGVAQLEQLPYYLEVKRKLANKYSQAFSDIKGVKLFKEPEGFRSNYWLNAIILDKEYANERDNILKITNDNGIMTRPAWTLIHKQSMYMNCPKMDISVAESLESRIINIPSSVFLGEEI